MYYKVTTEQLQKTAYFSGESCQLTQLIEKHRVNSKLTFLHCLTPQTRGQRNFSIWNWISLHIRPWLSGKLFVDFFVTRGFSDSSKCFLSANLLWPKCCERILSSQYCLFFLPFLYLLNQLENNTSIIREKMPPSVKKQKGCKKLLSIRQTTAQVWIKLRINPDSLAVGSEWVWLKLLAVKKKLN